MENLIIFFLHATFLFTTSYKDLREKRISSYPVMFRLRQEDVRAFVFNKSLNSSTVNIDSLTKSKRARNQTFFIFQDKNANFTYIDINPNKNQKSGIFLVRKNDFICTEEIETTDYVAFVIQKKESGFDQTLIIIGRLDQSEEIREIFEKIIENTKIGA